MDLKVNLSVPWRQMYYAKPWRIIIGTKARRRKSLAYRELD